MYGADICWPSRRSSRRKKPMHLLWHVFIETMWKNLSGEILIFLMACECGRGIFWSPAIIFLDNKKLASGAEWYPIHTALTRSSVHGCMTFPYNVKPYGNNNHQALKNMVVRAPHCIQLKIGCCHINEYSIVRWSCAAEKRMDPSMARAESPERYHCNPIMDASGLEGIAPRPATGYHSWLFVCALRRITL